MGWPTKNDKKRNSRSYDFRIERYKKLQNKNFRCQKFIWLIEVLQNVSFSAL